MANGIVTWYVRNTDTGRISDENYNSRDEAEEAAVQLNNESPYHSHVPTTATFFLDGAPFHIALFEKQEASPVVRQGDELDIAEHVDKIVQSLFDDNKMDYNQREACYNALLSLHGSTYANEWYSSTWYDDTESSYKPTSRREYTIVSFTRTETRIRADSPADAREQFKDQLSETNYITADRSNTVFDTLPTD